MIRGLAATGLCVLLILSLVGANAALAVDRGPLDADRVTASAEEADLYAEVQEEIVQMLLEEDIEVPVEGMDAQLETVVRALITEEWIQNEGERNIENLYAHIQDGEELELRIELESQQNQIAEALAAEFSLQDLDIEEINRLTADQESYEAFIAEIREDLIAEIGANPDDGFGVEVIQDLLADESSYEETRESIRTDIVEEALEELQAAQGFGNERLAGMYDSAETYEAEQSAFREEQKERIQEETSQELSDEELADAYEDEQDEILDQAAEEIEAEIEFEEENEIAEERAGEIALLKAEGLATDLDHATFVERYDGLVDDIEADIRADMTTNPDRYAAELEDEMEAELADADVPEQLEDDAMAIGELTVEAILTDMTYDEYVVQYDALVQDLEDAAVAYLQDNRAEYDEEIYEAILGEAALDGLPESVKPETEALIDHIVDAVITQQPYEEFMTELEAHEADLANGLAVAMFEEGHVPGELDFSEQVKTAMGNELAALSDAVDYVFPVTIGLFALAALLIGGVYLVLRDIALTAVVAGTGGIVAGTPMLALGWVAPGMIADFLAEEADDLSDGLAESLIAMIDLVVFAPVRWQSATIVLLGAIALVAGLAIHFGLDESLRAAMADDDTQESDAGEE